MLAVFALDSFADEERLTLVAGTAHALRRFLSCHFLAGRTVRHCRGPVVARMTSINSDESSRNPLSLCGFGLRMARALFASGMIAVSAEFLRTKGGIASMARTMDPQADLPFHAWCAGRDGCGPFAGFEGETIFGEHGLCFLLLARAGLHGIHAYDGRRGGLVVLDDLRYLRGDRESWHGASPCWR